MAGREHLAQSWGDLPARLDHRVADWLVDAVAPGRRPGTWLGSAPPEGLLVAAELHGVEGWTRRRAAVAGIDVPGLDTAVHAVLGRHQRGVADLSVARAALAGAGVPHLVVKGPAVARWYAEPSLRSSVDLDLVVAPAALAQALDALERHGFDLLDANWPLLRRADVHEVTLRSPSGGALDLHWSLGPSPMSIDHSPEFEVLLGRAVQIETGAHPTMGLGDLDAVVHLAVHAAASGGHRLVWLTDLRAALAATQPDPADLRDVAGQWGAVPAVELMLGRLVRILAAPDERAAAGALASPRAVWPLLDRVASRVSPPERVGTGPALSRLLARSSRSTQGRSLRALGGKIARRAVGGGGDLSPASLADATSERSARHSVGGTSGREEFLSWVLTEQRRGRR